MDRAPDDRASVFLLTSDPFAFGVTNDAVFAKALRESTENTNGQGCASAFAVRLPLAPRHMAQRTRQLRG